MYAQSGSFLLLLRGYLRVFNYLLSVHVKISSSSPTPLSLYLHTNRNKYFTHTLSGPLSHNLVYQTISSKVNLLLIAAFIYIQLRNHLVRNHVTVLIGRIMKYRPAWPPKKEICSHFKIRMVELVSLITPARKGCRRNPT